MIAHALNPTLAKRPPAERVWQNAPDVTTPFRPPAERIPGLRRNRSDAPTDSYGTRVKSDGISNKLAFAALSVWTLPRSVKNTKPGAGLPDGAGAASPLEPFIAIVEYIARFWAGGTGPDLWAVNVGRQPPDATKFSGRCGYR